MSSTNQRKIYQSSRCVTFNGTTMFFLSILYMYSTLMQWWRLGALKNKLRGTLNAQNALLVCKDTVIHDPKRPRCFESLLFKNGDRIACTIVPKVLFSFSLLLYRYRGVNARSAASITPRRLLFSAERVPFSPPR